MNQARSDEEEERQEDFFFMLEGICYRKDRGQKADCKKAAQQSKNLSEGIKKGLPRHSSG